MSQHTLIDSRILIKTQKSLRYRQDDVRNIIVTIYLYDYAYFVFTQKILKLTIHQFSLHIFNKLLKDLSDSIYL